ncbi:uncharacterized protein LOC132624207 [Lycium barbarum]|uniref:uncharacterized protein LOC132624207 n=1 Tax=Lycium barbarum TaxID=112863 RepID=UPI00293F3C49|nr:uncharacterized protein LOC132624207 [Lycium barbarum]
MASVQKLESQMQDISRKQHPPQKGGLPSDTILNPKNGGGGVDRVYALSNRSGKILQNAEKKVDNVPVSSKKHERSTDISKSTVKGTFHPLTQLLKATPPFPQRLAKKTEDAKCQRFYDQLKQFSMNIPFLDAFQKMPRFAKYLKELLTKKKHIKHDTHHFARDLCDNGASINLMPLAIYRPLGLEMPRPTTVQLQMADRSVKKPVGVMDDVIFRVGEFLLPVEFVILDCIVDRDIPIILGRPFLSIGKAFMDSEKNEIKF